MNAHKWERVPDFDGMTGQGSLRWRCTKCGAETRCARRPSVHSKISVQGSRMIDGPWTYYLEVDGPRDRGMTCNETVAWQVMES